MIVAQRTDVGVERSENQDAYGSASSAGVDFYIVCDGMGGHNGGSTASTMAVSIMEDFLREDDSAPQDRMREALQRANRAIYEESRLRPHLSGMGTTAVLVAVEHDTRRAWVAHVGDSRAYLIRQHSLVRMTRDHTLVQRLVDDGILTEEDAVDHPNSNVISRSLGGRADIEIEFGKEPLPIEDGDVFLLCTDGLTGLVEEDEIATTSDQEDLDAAADVLIERARQEGGYDNITVSLIRVGEHQASDRPWQMVHPGLGVSYVLAWDHAHRGLAAPPGEVPAHVRERIALARSQSKTQPTSRLTAPGQALEEEDPVMASSKRNDELRTALIILAAMAVVVLLVAVISWQLILR